MTTLPHILHSSMQIPKRLCKASVTLFNDKIIDGEFFLSHASSRHDGAETLPELLNDNTRDFVPFTVEHNTLLLSRPAIRSVVFESPDLMDLFGDPENEHIYPLEVVFRTETQEVALNGVCCTAELRPERRRPVDLLNEPGMFLLVFSDGYLTLLNKNAISHIDLHVNSKGS